MRECNVKVDIMDNTNQIEDGNWFSLGHGPEFEGDCFSKVTRHQENIEMVPLWDGSITVEEYTHRDDRLVVTGADGPSGGRGITGEFKIPCDMVEIGKIASDEKLTCENLKNGNLNPSSSRPTHDGEFPTNR